MTNPTLTPVHARRARERVIDRMPMHVPDARPFRTILNALAILAVLGSMFFLLVIGG